MNACFPLRCLRNIVLQVKSIYELLSPCFRSLGSGWHIKTLLLKIFLKPLKKQSSACCFQYFQTTPTYCTFYIRMMKCKKIWVQTQLLTDSLWRCVVALQKQHWWSLASITSCNDCMGVSLLTETSKTSVDRIFKQTFRWCHSFLLLYCISKFSKSWGLEAHRFV